MIQTEATISKVVTMRDKSLRLQVDTQELGGDDMASLMKLFGKFGAFVFAESESELDETKIKVPKYAKIEASDKTPSQRLGAVLFKVWQIEGETGIFDNYYRDKMETIISHFKKKLNNLPF